jgi:hypothetical protein
MPRTRLRKASALAILAALGGATAAWASGATFAITAQGIALGEAREVQEGGKPQPPRFHATAELGKPFTLTAQGMVLPRGGKAQPGQPDAGAWGFDRKAFKRLAADKKQVDKTRIVIRLEPTAAGRSRVRFTGKILGYDRTFDVLVEVVSPKKE